MTDQSRTTYPPVSAEERMSINEQIAWLLAHPGVSRWLKDALLSAEATDPVHLLNEVTLLSFVLRRRAEVQIREAVLPKSAAKAELDPT